MTTLILVIFVLVCEELPQYFVTLHGFLWSFSAQAWGNKTVSLKMVLEKT
jgi:hypothetical protein